MVDGSRLRHYAGQADLSDLQEEGGYEYASYHPSAKPEGEEAHAEPIALYQQMPGEAGGGRGGGESEGLTVAYKKNACAEQRGKGGRHCEKESKRQPTSPIERCLLAAGAGTLVSWVPSVDVDAGDAAAAACSAAVGSPGGPQKW